jgi:hypothetical protein
MFSFVLAASVQRIITLGFFYARQTWVGIPGGTPMGAPRSTLSVLCPPCRPSRSRRQALSDQQCAAEDGHSIPCQSNSVFMNIHADVSAAWGGLEAEQGVASEVGLSERCQGAVCGPGDWIFGDAAGWCEEA